MAWSLGTSAIDSTFSPLTYEPSLCNTSAFFASYSSACFSLSFFSFYSLSSKSSAWSWSKDFSASLLASTVAAWKSLSYSALEMDLGSKAASALESLALLGAVWSAWAQRSVFWSSSCCCFWSFASSCEGCCWLVVVSGRAGYWSVESWDVDYYPYYSV